MPVILVHRAAPDRSSNAGQLGACVAPERALSCLTRIAIHLRSEIDLNLTGSGYTLDLNQIETQLLDSLIQT